MKKYKLENWIQELEETVDGLDKMIGKLFKEIYEIKEQRGYDHPWTTTVPYPMGSDGTSIGKKSRPWPTYGEPLLGEPATIGDPFPVEPSTTGGCLPRSVQTSCDIGQGGFY